MQDLGQVHGLAAGCVEDLLAATESIGDNQGLRLRLADRRKKHSFSDCLRECVLVFFESEWARHSAAAGVERFQIRAHATQEGLFVGEPHDGLVMAMSMKEHLL